MTDSAEITVDENDSPSVATFILQALESMDQGISLFDKELRLVAFNRRFEELFDYPPELLAPGTPLEDFVRFNADSGEYGGGAGDEEIRRRVDDAGKSESRLYERTLPDGTIVEVRRDPLPGGGLIFAYRDITERKEMEIALAKSEEQNRAILESAAEGIITIDETGIVLTFNPAAEGLFGYAAGEIIGNSVNLLMPKADADRHDGYLQRYLTTGDAKVVGIGTRDVIAQRKDGTEFPIGLNVSEFTEASERRFIGTIRDITRHKQAEAALLASEERLKIQVAELMDREERLETQGAELVGIAEDLALAQAELERLNQEKDKFFSIIAHDLKSPFNTLPGFSEMLSVQAEVLEKDKVAEYAALLHESASQVFRLLENLLEWARLQRGHVDFAPEPTNLKEIVETNLSLFGPVAAGKDIELVGADNPDLVALCDRPMTDTIIRNLINNAIKFTDEGGTIAVSLAEDGDRVSVAVTDDGIGMAPEKIARLFRLDEKTTTKGTGGEIGTGLGLHLCQELVERQGGVITVDSAAGEGSTFSFTLPAAS